MTVQPVTVACLPVGVDSLLSPLLTLFYINSMLNAGREILITDKFVIVISGKQKNPCDRHRRVRCHRVSGTADNISYSNYY